MKRAKGEMCGCHLTHTRRGTPAVRCSEATLWRFLSKAQFSVLKRKHGKKAFCATFPKAKKRGKRR